MGYTVERVEAEQALKSIAEYEYALLYRISEIVFCKAADCSELAWDECLEARFFDKTKELHVYEEDGTLCAVKAAGTIDSDCLVRKYRLQKHYFGENKYLCVCEHLGYDEDGQALVVLTRLTGIE